MAIRKAITIISGREQVMPSTDILTNVGTTYLATTARNTSEYAQYFSSGVTDANGRITFNLTTDGTTNGPAIFSAIHSYNCICLSNSTIIASLPNYFVESISVNLKQITVRGMSSQALLTILGISVAQAAFIGAGVDGHIQVWGLP